ncbi:MAG: AAA family ATPase [Rhodobacterales bacterium]|nr:AAA family ATPase [Rhodobacterales bacterium]
MKFHSVEIENFGAIGKAVIPLNERGLVLIQGENEDDTSANSNGAGKSTIVEAISWCLYGKTAKGLTGDAVINRAAGKGCVVKLLLEDDGVVFQIVRGRKHKEFKSNLHIMQDGKDMTKGVDKLNQDLVERIIGCPYEVFVAAVYSGQEAMPDLPNMTDKPLKMLIEEAAGITLLERAYDLARNALAEKKDKLALVQAGEETAKARVEALHERVKDAEAAADRWVAERDARVIDLETNARTLLRDAKTAEADIAAMPKETDLLAQKDRLKEKMARHDNDQAELARLQGVTHKAEREAQGKKAVADTLLTAVRRIERELEALNDQIGQPCSACGRAHDKSSLASAIDAKKSELADKKTEARSAIEVYKDALADAQKASKSASDFARDMTDMSTAIALSDDISASLTALREAKSKRDDLTTRAKEIVAKIKTERERENPHKPTIDKLKEDRKEAMLKLKELRDSIEPFRVEVAVAQDVVELYSPKGVRAHILDTVTPYLNERTAHYLGALSDGAIEAMWQTITLTAKGEPREKFSIQVTHTAGGDSFAALSGGEKRKVRIATAMALQDLVATRAAKSLDLFIADEIDAALDVSSLERLMMVLDEKARERGSVFIISHSDLRDWCSNVMTVRKKDGVSEVLA